MVPAALASRLVEIVTANVRRRYPYHQTVTLFDDGDVRPPHQLTPIFAGAFDWHSAVHSHWCLARLGRAGSLDGITEAAVAAELAFLQRRPGFELPYGLAWLLTLAAELRAVDAARAALLAPLERLARDRLIAWCGRLPAPVRSGEHSQSAFALGLALDWARAVGDRDAWAAFAGAAERHHAGDRDAALHLEPSAYDFLSPTLGVAALIARVRPSADFAAWLDGFAPLLGRAETLTPVATTDRADGKLVHWDGLNLSRAWMLAEIAAALPDGDEREPALTALAAAHGEAGVAALDDMSYAGSHWLPTFAIYWLTGRI